MILRAVGFNTPNIDPNFIDPAQIDTNAIIETAGKAYNEEIIRSNAAPWVLGLVAALIVWG